MAPAITLTGQHRTRHGQYHLYNKWASYMPDSKSRIKPPGSVLYTQISFASSRTSSTQWLSQAKTAFFRAGFPFGYVSIKPLNRTGKSLVHPLKTSIYDCSIDYLEVATHYWSVLKRLCCDKENMSTTFQVPDTTNHIDEDIWQFQQTNVF